MSTTITVPEICTRIDDLHLMLKNRYPANEVGKRINDVLVHADQIPLRLLKPAWELFAQKKGVNKL